MRNFFFTAFGLLVYVAAVFTFSTMVSAFNQRDSTAKVDTQVTPVQELPINKEVKVLEKVSEQKDVRKDLLKDSIQNTLQDLGNLKPVVTKTVKQTAENFKVAERNLVQTILSTPDNEIKPLGKLYRIDTSPRPVIINVIFPVIDEKAPKRRGWLIRRR